MLLVYILFQMLMKLNRQFALGYACGTNHVHDVSVVVLFYCDSAEI